MDHGVATLKVAFGTVISYLLSILIYDAPNIGAIILITPFLFISLVIAVDGLFAGIAAAVAAGHERAGVDNSSE